MSETFEALLTNQLNELKALLVRKRHDYGPGNLTRHGEYGVLVRLSDKVERLNTLLGSGADPLNESIEDTWQDVAGYALLALLMREVGPDAFGRLPVSAPAASDGATGAEGDGR